jgi:hypothetical protein
VLRPREIVFPAVAESPDGRARDHRPSARHGLGHSPYATRRTTRMPTAAVLARSIAGPRRTRQDRSDIAMTTRVVPSFLPSTSGFRFPNAFPHVPLRRIGIPGVITVPIGDASNGLCGGMAFAVRDYFEAGRTPPDVTTPPGDGALFDYLVERLFDSFDLPSGPTRYLQLMSPALSDGDSLLARLGLAPHGRAWRMITQEWPQIRRDIDEGALSTLGLVRVKSIDPLDLGDNHQVLAYGYERSGGTLTLRLYDPNRPGRDDVTLSLSVSDPTRATPVRVFPAGPPVFAFFRVPYGQKSPP